MSLSYKMHKKRNETSEAVQMAINIFGNDLVKVTNDIYV